MRIAEWIKGLFTTTEVQQAKAVVRERMEQFADEIMDEGLDAFRSRLELRWDKFQADFTSQRNNGMTPEQEYEWLREHYSTLSWPDLRSLGKQFIVDNQSGMQSKNLTKDGILTFLCEHDPENLLGDTAVDEDVDWSYTGRRADQSEDWKLTIEISKEAIKLGINADEYETWEDVGIAIMDKK